MRYRTAFLIAAIIIVGMFILQLSTQRAVNIWASQGVELSRFQILRIEVSNFWFNFGWLSSLVIVGFFSVIAYLTNPKASKRS